MHAHTLSCNFFLCIVMQEQLNLSEARTREVEKLFGDYRDRITKSSVHCGSSSF